MSAVYKRRFIGAWCGDDLLLVSPEGDPFCTVSEPEVAGKVSGQIVVTEATPTTATHFHGYALFPLAKGGWRYSFENNDIGFAAPWVRVEIK